MIIDAQIRINDFAANAAQVPIQELVEIPLAKLLVEKLLLDKHLPIIHAREGDITVYKVRGILVSESSMEEFDKALEALKTNENLTDAHVRELKRIINK